MVRLEMLEISCLFTYFYPERTEMAVSDPLLGSSKGQSSRRRFSVSLWRDCLQSWTQPFHTAGVLAGRAFPGGTALGVTRLLPACPRFSPLLGDVLGWFRSAACCVLGSRNASSTPSRITRTANYSPTTGTCQMSPFTSPTSAKEEHRNEPSNGKRRRFSHLNLMERKESTPQDNDEFMTILSKVEKSSDRVMEIMQNLNSIQALKGNRELENLIGISFTCCSLKKEMEKTKELMTKVMKQKLFEKKNTGLPHKELQHLDSYEFLKAALN